MEGICVCIESAGTGVGAVGHDSPQRFQTRLINFADPHIVFFSEFSRHSRFQVFSAAEAPVHTGIHADIARIRILMWEHGLQLRQDLVGHGAAA